MSIPKPLREKIGIPENFNVSQMIQEAKTHNEVTVKILEIIAEVSDTQKEILRQLKQERGEKQNVESEK